MDFQKTVLLLLLLSSFPVFGQYKGFDDPLIINPPGKTLPVYNDFSVILNEETLNKVFVAMGDLSGTNDYSLLLVKGKYKWTVLNPSINLKPDKSDFTCMVKVNVGPFEYNNAVKGQIKIWYDSPQNQINIKLITAVFEIYDLFLGKKIHIKNIELAYYLKDPFQFDGPKTMGINFEFMTPDSVLKKIFIQPDDCLMEVRNKEIVVNCEVKVSDKPIEPCNSLSKEKSEIKK